MAINLFSKIKNLMARSLVTLLEGGGYQVTLLNGETRSDLEHLQEFGLASVKPAGSIGNGICVFYGGNRSNGSLLVMEFPDIKPTLTAGESALFNAHSTIVKLTAAGIVELNGATNLGLIKITEQTEKLNAHIIEYNAHVHAVGATPPNSPVVKAAVFVAADYENDKVVH